MQTMANTVKHTLGKTERLKSRKLIGQLFSSGVSFSVFPFRVIYMVQAVPPPEPALPQPPMPPLRAAFSVSTRNFKKAVHRNRVKRLMREAWRLQKNPLEEMLTGVPASMAVFLIYTGKEIPEYVLVAEKLQKILERLYGKAMLP